MNTRERFVSDETRGDTIDKAMHDSSVTVSKDLVFHLLQNSRRRAVLRYLIERDEDVLSMREVSEQVAAWEDDTTVARLSSDARQRVYIALYQSHLPKLHDSGVIEYDRDRGTLSPLPPLTVFEPYLDQGLHADSVLSIKIE